MPDRPVDAAEDWVRTWSASMSDRAAAAQALSDQVSRLAVSATDRDRTITVTVNGSGGVTDLRLSPEAGRHGTDRLAEEIPLPPEPPVHSMSVGELTALVEARDVYRAKAVLELAARSAADDAAASALGGLTRLPLMRDDRLFHLVSLAWAGIIGLLAAETDHSRRTAYAAFGDLEPDDRSDLLSYLRADRIEDAHPRL